MDRWSQMLRFLLVGFSGEGGVGSGVVVGWVVVAVAVVPEEGQVVFRWDLIADGINGVVAVGASGAIAAGCAVAGGLLAGQLEVRLGLARTLINLPERDVLHLFIKPVHFLLDGVYLLLPPLLRRLRLPRTLVSPIFIAH